tara:strand:+ start:131 stop:265 length:135 start_codon:yes stop_codon:yes gene_type:complete
LEVVVLAEQVVQVRVVAEQDNISSIHLILSPTPVDLDPMEHIQS